MHRDLRHGDRVANEDYIEPYSFYEANRTVTVHPGRYVCVWQLCNFFFLRRLLTENSDKSIRRTSGFNGTGPRLAR